MALETEAPRPRTMIAKRVAFGAVGFIAGAIVGLIAAINAGLLMGVDYEHTLDHAFGSSPEGLVITALLVFTPVLGVVGMWRWAGRPRGHHRQARRSHRDR